MIAEPYICTNGPTAGEIWWWNSDGQCVYEGCIDKKVEECWVPYAAFEREKLRNLASLDNRIRVSDTHYELRLPSQAYTWSLLGLATEASLLLSRTAFLHDVCEKEGVEWLPQDCVAKAAEDDHCEQCCNGSCGCPCHNPDPIVARVQVHDIPPAGEDIVHGLTRPLPDSQDAV